MKSNLVLSLVLVTLGGFAYWYEFKRPPSQNATDSARLLNFDSKTEFESLRVVDAEKKFDLEAHCSENCKLGDLSSNWQIKKPIDFPADAGNISTFLTNVTMTTVVQTLSFDQNFDEKLKEFGLDGSKRDSRRIEVRLKGKSTPIIVYLGDSSAIDDNMYVVLQGGEPKHSDRSVYLVPAYLKNGLQRSLTHWRSKRLFDFSASQIEKLTLQNLNGSTLLSKKGNDWKLAEKFDADDQAVDTYLTGLQYMNVLEFLSEDKNSDRGKLKLSGKPNYVVGILLAGQSSELRLEVFDVVVDKQPHLYGILSNKPFIFELEHVHSEKLSKKSDSFRVRTLLPAQAKNSVARFSVEFKGQTKIDVLKNDPRFDGLLAKIAAARVSEFKTNSALPKDAKLVSQWMALDATNSVMANFDVYSSKSGLFGKISEKELVLLEPGSGAAIPKNPTELTAK